MLNKQIYKSNNIIKNKSQIYIIARLKSKIDIQLIMYIIMYIKEKITQNDASYIYIRII